MTRDHRVEISMNEIKFLVSFFNANKGTKFQKSTKSLQEMIATAGEKGWTVPEIKTAMKKYEGSDIRECLQGIILSEAPVIRREREEVKIEKVEVEKVEPAQALGILEQAMAKIFVETKGTEIAENIMKDVEKKVSDFIKSEYGSIERKVSFDFEGRKVEFKEALHEMFDTVLAFVAANEPVFLSGPAGSGKNVICKQVATALDLDFYFTNAVTQEYKITGFTDAMGIYHESQFYKAFKNGGLFFLDEMDASIPEVLIILNAAIANRYFDFPAPIGYVEAHENFRVVSAGNTFGHGASYQYVGRNQLDGSSLDRFSFVPINYSIKIEESCANGDAELLSFIRDFRKASDKAGVNIIVSYRSINRIAKMQEHLGIPTTIKTCLTKNLEADDLNMIIDGMSYENKYINALRQIAKEVA